MSHGQSTTYQPSPFVVLKNQDLSLGPVGKSQVHVPCCQDWCNAKKVASKSLENRDLQRSRQVRLWRDDLFLWSKVVDMDVVNYGPWIDLETSPWSMDWGYVLTQHPRLQWLWQTKKLLCLKSILSILVEKMCFSKESSWRITNTAAIEACFIWTVLCTRLKVKLWDKKFFFVQDHVSSRLAYVLWSLKIFI